MFEYFFNLQKVLKDLRRMIEYQSNKKNFILKKREFFLHDQINVKAHYETFCTTFVKKIIRKN